MILSLLTGCALRRNELARLQIETIQLWGKTLGAGRPVRKGKTHPYRGKVKTQSTLRLNLHLIS